MTLTQLAARAEVSLKTASRAVNGEVHVATATRDRVLQTAAEMGFELNRAASMLARGVVANAVGLIIGDLSNPFYAALAKGVERGLRQAGWELIVASSDEDALREEQLIDSLLQRQVSALVVVSTTGDHRHLAGVQARGVPVVFVDRRGVGITADAVVIDNVGGAYAGARHLIDQGFHRVAFLGDLARLEPHRERLTGFRQALTDAGIDTGSTIVREDAHDARTAAALTRSLMTTNTPPDAVFASNNRISLGVLHGLREETVHPAVLGFDDFDGADLLGVSVLAHDTVAMGASAAKMLLRSDRATTPAREVLEPVTLIERGSAERPSSGRPDIR